MDLAYVMRELWRLRVLIALGACLATFASLATAYKIYGSSPFLEKRSLELGAASTQLLVDSPRSSLGDLNREFTPLTSRAAIYSQFMTSAPLRAVIAREAGIPTSALVAEAAASSVNMTRTAKEPTSGERANDLVAEGRVFRLYLEQQPEIPVVGIYAQANTARNAEKLANAAATGLISYLDNLQNEQDVPAGRRVVVSQLGEARGGVVNPGVDRIVMVLMFIVVLTAWSLGVLFLQRVRRAWVTARTLEQMEEVEWLDREPAEDEVELEDRRPVAAGGSARAARDGG